VALFLAAVVVAERTDVGKRLRVDLQGSVAQGSAERISDGLYRLRYTHPDGAVYSKSYRGHVSLDDSGHATPLRIAYSPMDPQFFQPAGASYFPAAIVLVLVTVGAGLAFYANHRLVRRGVSRRRR
jgi:hypothetical protein